MLFTFYKKLKMVSNEKVLGFFNGSVFPHGVLKYWLLTHH